MDACTRWSLNPLAALHWRCWDEEWVLFDAGSGQTHQMDPVAAATLMAIEAGPVSMLELLSEVALNLSVENAADLEEFVLPIVDQLIRLGLIESPPQ